MSLPKILIALYAYYPFANANTNVILPLIKELSKSYEISIVSKNNNNTAPDFELLDGVCVYRYKTQNILLRTLHMVYYMDIKKKRALWKNGIITIMHMVSSLLHKFDCFKHREYCLLKKMLKKNEYEFVLSTCESYLSCVHILKLKKELKFQIPWIAYFMDPNSNYIGNAGFSMEHIMHEVDIYKYSDLILVTEEIYEENKSNIFTPYLYKTIPFRFGNIRFVENELVNPIFITGKINCVYVGSLLDERIRSPRYLFKLINELDDRFVIHMVCNRLSKSTIDLCNSIVSNNRKIRWYNTLPLQECMGIISNADILINLGNRSRNQLPSKIFDYISTGKPIVNLYSLHNDTSKHYLENYPNKLNIYENDDQLFENVQAFLEFTSKYSGKTISKDQLLDLYSEYDSEVVTKETIKIINDFVMSRRGKNGI